ncbi:sugar transferase [Planococcus sp. APC 3906]|uniref:sugar transferase n=1 Tax=Planococcus sp. APC 3906 TaxID=3035194 RepID=UPI0025B41F90|nr:sugar transferase [Planococcus sp. APC 3906]MDN3450100.1 sugar transferase [Planococcus sp. APC 3906]
MAVSSEKKQGHALEVPPISIESAASQEAKYYFFFKRMIDVTFSLMGMLLLLPLFLVIYILIKAEDMHGSVLFKQQRVGKNGELFYMYKFRSMVSNAEALKEALLQQNEATGPVFKIKYDPRVTKVGRVIRRMSIDELPQLINVLRGEMSLVGPRPALPDEVEQYTEYEKQRIQVTPGLTCYWQVSGRSNIRFDEWIALDLKYIEQKSLWVDFKLIFKTVFVLFGSKDAY